MGCCSKENTVVQTVCGGDAKGTATPKGCCREETKNQTTVGTQDQSICCLVPPDDGEKEMSSVMDCCGPFKEGEDCCSATCAEKLAAIECKENRCGGEKGQMLLALSPSIKDSKLQADTFGTGIIPGASCESAAKNYCCSPGDGDDPMFLDTKDESASPRLPFGKPCASHLRSAMDRYRKQLKLASCFCRDVFEKPLDRCCKRRRVGGYSEKAVLRTQSVESGGHSTSLGIPRVDLHHVVTPNTASTKSCGHNCSERKLPQNDCSFNKDINANKPFVGCSNKERSKSLAPVQDGCCQKESQISGYYKDSCCVEKAKDNIRSCGSCPGELERYDRRAESHCQGIPVRDGTSIYSCCNSESETGFVQGRCCRKQLQADKPCGGSLCKVQTKKDQDFHSKCGGEEMSKSGCVGDDCCKEATQKRGCSGDECCKTAISKSVNVKGCLPVSTIDEERGIDLEHISLSVDGMTCTGCAKKVLGTLSSITGIININVSFTTGTADFDLKKDGSSTVSDVVSLLEHQTGFKCTKIGGVDEYIDVIVSSSQSARTIAEEPPFGVLSAELIRKNVLRITYDTAAVGARDVLSNLGNLVHGLAPPPANITLEQGKRRLYTLLVETLLSAILTIPVVVLAWASTPVSKKTSGLISLFLATAVQAIAVPEFYKPALTSLFYYGMIEMDMLVVMSISAAYGYSVIAFSFLFAGKPLETESFFETSTLLITLVLLGRLVTSLARQRAIAAVSLHSFQIKKALLWNGHNDITEIDVRLLQQGDIFVVMPHSQIPTDGKVLDGKSEVDESLLTGENLPIAKEPGSIVLAGTMNGEGTLRVRITRLPGNNTVSEIGRLVDQAAKMKPRSQDLADKISRYFIPLILSVSLAVFSIWIAVCIRARHKDVGDAIVTAITYAIAVLAISCPCALGLAVPMVHVVAGGVSARQGIIVKSAETLENATHVTDILFDKTGTITTGELEVTAEYILEDEPQTMQMVSAIVQATQHPVSKAVSDHLKQSRELISMTLLDAQSIPGCGVIARTASSQIKAGNPHWLNLTNHPTVQTLHGDYQTVLCVVKDSLPIAIFGLKAHIRPEARSVIQRLQNRGIVAHLVSGDTEAVVRNTGEMLNIPSSNIVSQCAPATKRTYVQDLITGSSTGQNPKGNTLNRTVLFVGDGTNDAAAISQSHVGVQLGSFSDLTRATADVVILSNNLESVITLLDLAAAARRRILFNFVWAGIYNLFAILFAAGAFVKFRVPPAWAGLGELVSVLPVVIVGVSMVWRQ